MHLFSRVARLRVDACETGGRGHWLSGTRAIVVDTEIVRDLVEQHRGILVPQFLPCKSEFAVLAANFCDREKAASISQDEQHQQTIDVLGERFVQ